MRLQLLILGAVGPAQRRLGPDPDGVLPSQVHHRTFELLGADPEIMDLSEAIDQIVGGTLDAQENPFANTVTYGVHNYHEYHTQSNHFYISRPIFLHRPTFDAWPEELQQEMRAAVQDAVAFQRGLKDQEEEDAAAAIREAGGEILQLSAEEVEAFVEAVNPIYGEAQDQYDRDLLGLVGL